MENPAVRQDVLVDDVAHVVSHGGDQTAEIALDLADKVCRAAKRLRLRISFDKTFALISPPALAKTMAKLLKQQGCEMQVSTAARDTGTWLNLSGKRAKQMANSRKAKAIKRGNKVKQLAKVWRGARTLTTTGVAPQAFWDRPTVGLSADEARKWRSIFADAAGLTAQGRCALTAVWLAFGFKSEPLAFNTRLQLQMWLQTWREHEDLRPQLRQAWRKAVSQVIVSDAEGGQGSNKKNQVDEARGENQAGHTHDSAEAQTSIRWINVTGALTATVAMLHQIGWVASYADFWKCPAGVEFAVDTSGSLNAFLDYVQKGVSKLLWRDASRGRFGGGLENGGPDDFISLSFLRSLREQARFEEAALLESFMAAACWDDSMCREAGFDVESSCSCTAVGAGTLPHLLYDCPEYGAKKARASANFDIGFEDEIDQTLRETSWVCDRAREGLLVCPALWLRGLLPASAKDAIDKPSEKITCKMFGAFPQGGLLRSNLLFLDGSGGRFSEYPPIRRCGFGLAVVSFNGASPKLLFGIAASLPGESQTTARAELFALVFGVFASEPCVNLTAVTDNEATKDRFAELKAAGFPEPSPEEANADLWVLLCKAAKSRPGSLDVRWVKAHIAPGGEGAELKPGEIDFKKAAEKYPSIRFSDVLGNVFADALADIGASLAELPGNQVAGFFADLKLVRCIQKRAVAVLRKAPKRKKVSRQAAPSTHALFTPSGQNAAVALPSLANTPLTTSHDIFVRGLALVCRKCGEYRLASRKAKLREWLSQSCEALLPQGACLQKQAVEPTPVAPGAAASVGHKHLHESHVLWGYKGLTFCQRCGRFASRKAQGLQLHCSAPSGFGTATLARIGKDLPPQGFLCWPDEREDLQIDLCIDGPRTSYGSGCGAVGVGPWSGERRAGAAPVAFSADDP